MESNTLIINESNTNDLLNVAKWSKFLAICGFVMSAILICIAIGMFFMGGTLLGASSGAPFYLISIIYIVMALIYVYPCLCMYQSAISLKAALTSNDQNALNQGFLQMNKYYSFMGILMIIVLAFYALAIIGGVAAMLFMRG